jgi:hypothetical protein
MTQFLVDTPAFRIWDSSMKSLFWVVLLLAVFPASLSARLLTSEDGSKTMDAEFVRYIVSSDMVTLRLDGRNMVLPAARFSDEDRKFFEESQRENDKKKAIKVKIDPNNDWSKETKGSVVISYRTASYTFEVSNTSESYLDGLKLRYWLVVQQGEKGQEKIDIKSQTHELMPLAGGASEKVKGPELKLALGAKSDSCATCPKVRQGAAEKAGKVDRERVLGTKVEVVDSKGEVIYSDVSSNRVQSLLADKKTN